MALNQSLNQLRAVGVSELAYQFARFILRLEQNNDENVAVLAALVSEAISQGHVCLNLHQLGRQGTNIPAELPDSEHCIQLLQASNVVGKEGEYAPLILTDGGLLYLYRYWQAEQLIANDIRKRCRTLAITKPEQLQQDFADWPSQEQGIDWQKIAVLMALTRQFSVISGGPGTGKTTIVLRLLTMLHTQSPTSTIALAAPTGKAAARLQQVITAQGHLKLEAKTLHRLLGISSRNENGRYTPKNPLAVDVLIIDEASMIDIVLMAKVLNSLAANTRVILLGDSQQLASVESGAILANLCDKPSQFSAEFCQLAQQMTTLDLTPSTIDHSVLHDSTVLLQHSYRFDDKSEIGQLARAVRLGELTAVYDVLAQVSSIWQQKCDDNTILNEALQGYKAYFDAIVDGADAQHCLQLFDGYRLLCALKNGPQSVNSVNQLLAKALRKLGWHAGQDFYHGRPIMIVQNDYQNRLFNGDTGLVLNDSQGILRACFMENNQLRWVDLSRLPAHETAFAITIHKSQGSEFDHVCVLLPEQDTALLNRELLYTAITRAKQSIKLISSDEIIHKTVATQHQRETGLAALLN